MGHRALSFKRHPNSNSLIASKNVLGKAADFWLLGGASIVFWVAIVLAHFLKGSSIAVRAQLENIGITFITLSVLVNYPHFMLSYKFGYGRGLLFIKRNWIALVFVPSLMLGIFAFAYFSLNQTISTIAWSIPANRIFTKAGIPFQFGLKTLPGNEILGLGVLAMYLTVGWHYSKQVFGCMMVYGKYENYPFTKKQRNILIFSLYSIAGVNLLYRFFDKNYILQAFDAPVISPTIPSWVYFLSCAVFGLSLLMTCSMVFYKNYKEKKVVPSLNLMIGWIAFMLWWLPFLQIDMAIRIAVPFFHSLQYLPFAARLEHDSSSTQVKVALKVLLVVIVGFLAFEGIPSWLDQTLSTKSQFNTKFFMIAALVFINIHHFFIDSVTWKFNDPEIRTKLLHNK